MRFHFVYYFFCTISAFSIKFYCQFVICITYSVSIDLQIDHKCVIRAAPAWPQINRPNTWPYFLPISHSTAHRLLNTWPTWRSQLCQSITANKLKSYRIFSTNGLNVSAQWQFVNCWSFCPVSGWNSFCRRSSSNSSNAPTTNTSSWWNKNQTVNCIWRNSTKHTKRRAPVIRKAILSVRRPTTITTTTITIWVTTATKRKRFWMTSYGIRCYLRLAMTMPKRFTCRWFRTWWKMHDEELCPRKLCSRFYPFCWFIRHLTTTIDSKYNKLSIFMPWEWSQVL